jgi:signal transduction histidine kinase
VVVGFSYLQLSRAVYNNEIAPEFVYTTLIDIPITSQTGSNIDSVNYTSLSLYTISSSRINEIISSEERVTHIQTPYGVLLLDETQFIPKDANGDQKVWIYYRTSPLDASKYEIMVFVRPVNQIRQILGQFTNILILALPVIIVLAFIVGFLLIRRLLRPIRAIEETVRRIDDQKPYRAIEVPPGSEFGKLAATINQAFGRLHDTVNRERQLVSDASHELRAPLTVLRGEASLALKRTRTVEEYEKCLTVISEESSYLSSLVNKLLLIGHLDRSTELLDCEEFDLTDYLSQLSTSFKLLCDKRTITFKLAAKAGIKIRGDKLKLRELFFNLIDNAVKYNRNGGEVSLSLKLDGNYARVDISDKGIGIQQEHLGKIFERFYQVDKSISQNEGGAGLGLSICKRIVDLHNGKIEVASEFGKGSTFSVFLPLLNKQ